MTHSRRYRRNDVTSMSRTLRGIARCMAMTAGVSGCLLLPGLAPLAAGELQSATIPVQGLSRSVDIYRPQALADRPALVIALHGSGGDGRRFRQLTGGAFDRLADEHGFVVAYPDAIGGQWNDCRSSAPYRDALAGIDDAAFLRAVSGHAAKMANRPFAGVFVVGYSNGGHMVFRLAMEAPRDYAAFAAIGAHLPVPEEQACDASPYPAPIMLVSGTEDPINPWSGGRVRAPGGMTPGSVLPANDTAGWFLAQAGIDARPAVRRFEDTDPSDGTTVETRTWGPQQVVLMQVTGGGHSLPGPSAAFPMALVGPTSRDVDGAAEIWRFFSSRLGPE